MLQVTAIVYANPHWRREDGGKLRMWPPHTDSNAALPEHADAEQSLPNAGSHALTSRLGQPQFMDTLKSLFSRAKENDGTEILQVCAWVC